MRPVPDSEAFPMIACVYAVEQAAVRLAQQAGELEEARRIAVSQGYSLAEAAAIVRRSRR